MENLFYVEDLNKNKNNFQKIAYQGNTTLKKLKRRRITIIFMHKI